MNHKKRTKFGNNTTSDLVDEQMFIKSFKSLIQDGCTQFLCSLLNLLSPHLKGFSFLI